MGIFQKARNFIVSLFKPTDPARKVALRRVLIEYNQKARGARGSRTAANTAKLNESNRHLNLPRNYTLKKLLNERLMLDDQKHPTRFEANGQGITFTLPYDEQAAKRASKMVSILQETSAPGDLAGVKVTPRVDATNKKAGAKLILTLSARNADGLGKVKLPRFLQARFTQIAPRAGTALTKDDLQRWARGHVLSALKSMSRNSQARANGARVNGANAGTVGELIRANHQLKASRLGPTISAKSNKILELIATLDTLDPTYYENLYPTADHLPTLLTFELKEAMKTYLLHEKGVYNGKSQFDVTQDFTKAQSEKNHPIRVINHLLGNDKASTLRTIGSVRFPNAPSVTKKHVVWRYQLNGVETSKTKREAAENKSDDPWLRKLSRRQGFTGELRAAHDAVRDLLDKLVVYYLNEATTSRTTKNTATRRFAADLHEKCMECQLPKHPLFRICAGFDAIQHEDDKGFMDAFRYMVHNYPHVGRANNNSRLLIHKEDTKFFFFSSLLYPGRRNAQYSKQEALERRAIHGLLFDTFDTNSGNDTARSNDNTNYNTNDDIVVYAWPTATEALQYYRRKKNT